MTDSRCVYIYLLIVDIPSVLIGLSIQSLSCFGVHSDVVPNIDYPFSPQSIICIHPKIVRLYEKIID